MPTNHIPKYFSFTLKTDEIVTELETEIGLSLPYDRSYAGKKPKIFSKIGIWDTGAQSTVISAKVAKELRLKPIGKVDVRGVNSTIESNVYLVNLCLPNKIIISFVQVTEGNISSDVLVGMNIITLGDFSITNFNKKTIFSFRMPSKKILILLLK